MKRFLALLGCLVAVLAVAFETGAFASAPTSHPSSVLTRSISGTVGPSMTISMSKAHTRAGDYVITIHDLSALHNFHLTGPGGVDKATGVSFTGTVHWHVTLVAGKYHFQCDVHPLTMHGRLRVVSG